jgi:hypothetical protein
VKGKAMLKTGVPARGQFGILDLASLVPPPLGYSDDPIERLKLNKSDPTVHALLPARPPMTIFHLQPTAYMEKHCPPPSQFELAMRYHQF